MSEIDDLLNEEKETEKPDAPEADEPEKEEGEESPDADDGEDDKETKADEAASEDDKPEPEEKPKKPREQRSVPLAAFLDVQNKLKAELEEKDKKLADLEAKQKAAPDFSSFYKKPPEEIPSVYDDEQGFNTASREFMQAESFNTRFGMSASYAVRSHGQEKVTAALGAFDQAAQNNPLMKQAIDNSFDPVGEIVQWHETQTALQEIEAAGGLDAYKKALRAEFETELKGKKPETAAPEGGEDAPEPTKPNLPGNFNKGPKGGHKEGSPHVALGELLGD